MKLLFFVLLLGLPTWAAQAQAPPCACLTDFDFTVQYVERNLPAAQGTRPPGYARFKRQLRRAVARDPVAAHCLQYLNRYVATFHDSHSDVSGDPAAAGPAVPETDSVAVAAFRASPLFRHTECVRLLPLARPTQVTDLGGRYQTPDSTYTIQLQRSQTPLRDYVGVIVRARTPLWQPGQVKLELRRNPDGRTFSGVQYQRNHTAQVLPPVWLEQGRLRNTSWQQVGSPPLPPPASGQAQFRLLDSTTTYLRLPSFASTGTRQLDSLYRLAAPAIRRHANLIIDVRDNGGGSDQNVEPLIPFFTTGPFADDQLEEYFVTPDNIQRFAEYLHGLQQDSAQVGAATLRHVRQQLAWLQRAPRNQFVPNPETTGRQFTQPAARRPRRVVILYNQGCGSSCETLLFWAQHSAKTQLVGEPSGGYVGYGNVFSVSTPCLHLQLNTTTLRLPNQLPYEGQGVRPSVRLRPDEDWLTQTRRLLAQPTN